MAVADAAGNALPDLIKALVQSYLQAQREVNFIVNVIDPNYTTIDMAGTIIVEPRADVALTVAAANQAVADYPRPVRLALAEHALLQPTDRRAG